MCSRRRNLFELCVDFTCRQVAAAAVRFSNQIFEIHPNKLKEVASAARMPFHASVGVCVASLWPLVSRTSCVLWRSITFTPRDAGLTHFASCRLALMLLWELNLSTLRIYCFTKLLSNFSTMKLLTMMHKLHQYRTCYWYWISSVPSLLPACLWNRFEAFAVYLCLILSTRDFLLRNHNKASRSSDHLMLEASNSKYNLWICCWVFRTGPLISSLDVTRKALCSPFGYMNKLWLISPISSIFFNIPVSPILSLSFVSMELLFEFSVCPQPAVGSSHYRLSHTSPVNQNHGSQSPTEPTPAAPPPLITHDEQPSSTNLSLKSQWKPLPLPLASAEWISSSAGPSLQARASPCQSQAPSLPSRLMEAGLCFSSSLPSSKQFDQTVARSRCRWVKRLLCWRAGFQTPLCPSKKKTLMANKKTPKVLLEF